MCLFSDSYDKMDNYSLFTVIAAIFFIIQDAAADCGRCKLMAKERCDTGSNEEGEQTLCHMVAHNSCPHELSQSKETSQEDDSFEELKAAHRRKVEEDNGVMDLVNGIFIAIRPNVHADLRRARARQLLPPPTVRPIVLPQQNPSPQIPPVLLQLQNPTSLIPPVSSPLQIPTPHFPPVLFPLHNLPPQTPPFVFSL